MAKRQTAITATGSQLRLWGACAVGLLLTAVLVAQFTGTLWLHVFCLFKTHAGGVGLASLQSNPSRLAERTGPDRTGLATEIKTNKNEISQLGILQTKIINRIRNKKKNC